MMREIQVVVDTSSDPIEFRFDPSASIMALTIEDSSGKNIWIIMPEEMRPGRITPGSIRIWKAGEAPKEVVEQANQARENFYRRVEEQGPLKKPLGSVRYGIVPPGYRETSPAQPLAPGRYGVILFAEQGHGKAVLDVLPLEK